MRLWRWIGILVLGGFAATSGALAQDYPTHEAATIYLGNRPKGVISYWSDLMNGIASDRRSVWFLSQRDRIWRIPVGVDLGLMHLTVPSGVTSRGLIPEAKGWDHFGDADYLPVGPGYLLVPMEHDDPDPSEYDVYCGLLAVFRADDPAMPFVTRQCLDKEWQRHKAPWLAVGPGPDHVLYTSRFDVLPGEFYFVNRYQVNWSVLSSENPVLELKRMVPLVPFDTSGHPMEIQNVQGGVVSPSGRLLFLSSDEMGLLVFRIEQDRLQLLERSCNADPSASCRFSFKWDNTSPKEGLEQEPEGLEYWDLNDGRAPGVRGELHVGMVDVQVDTDALYIKHYTAIQWVDAAAPSGGNGQIGSPYQSLMSAMPAAWPGSIVRVRGHQPLPANTRLVSPGVRVEAWDRPAVLGD